ncbi:MAG: molybdopterin-dependent oxidoreductase, partial [Anaerolineaceae bacterium]|nr:molybdopterin-dependent oxidoreductase [Anaerolineaceae bacterium]
GLFCDFGRFHPLAEKRQRINTPLIRKNGVLKAATWDEALSVVSSKLLELESHKNDGVAAIASTRIPAESLYLFAQIFKHKIGSNMVTSTEEGTFTVNLKNNKSKEVQEVGIESIKDSDLILAIGVDLIKDHQVAGFFVKRALNGETKLISVTSETNGLDSFTAHGITIKKGSEFDFVKGISSAFQSGFSSDDAKTGVSKIDMEKLVNLIKNSKNPLIIFGNEFDSKNKAEMIEGILNFARATKSRIIDLKGKANSVIATKLDLDSSFFVNGHQAVFLALGDEEPSQKLIQKVENAPFIVVQASYQSSIAAKADVVLPVTNWLEQDGYYVSYDGKIQQTTAVLSPASDIKTNLEAFVALSKKLGMTADLNWNRVIN